MNNRISQAFAKAKAENRGAFVAYLTMGFPDLAKCEQAVDDVIAAGARNFAVVRAVCRSDDPYSAIRRLQDIASR